MAGFLKKIFSFGFGRKSRDEPGEEPQALPEPQAVEQPAVEAPAEPKPKKSKPAEKKKPVPKKPAAKKPAAKEEPEEAVSAKAPEEPAKKPAAKRKPARKKAKETAPEKRPELEAAASAEPVDVPPVTDEPKRPDIAPAEPPAPEPEETGEQETRREGWFKRLRKGLSKSSSALTENITAVFTKKKLDEDALQQLEDILIQADLGVDTAMNVTDALSSQRYGKDVTEDEVRSIMADEIEKVLAPVAQPLELDLDHKPHVILVVGVNGSGKTTTIGKLSAKLARAGYSTLLVAGDTFRAAAIEQLKIWGERTEAPVMSRQLGADAAGLAFDAFERAREEGFDVMLMDTAGRLQNKAELMAELEKIVRVMKKQDAHAPHTVLLTLDATTGQNALNQVEIFAQVAGVSGLVMTKLDGTARGGILVAISAKHELPVYFVGVGEQVDDLEPFEARDFARSIAGLN